MWYKFSQLNKEQYCEGAVSKLFIFDIDETLFRTFAKIYVRCTDGTGITLDNQQLNSFDSISHIEIWMPVRVQTWYLLIPLFHP